MKTSVQGFPRIGAHRELKFATEAYLSGKTGPEELGETSARIRLESWRTMRDNGIDLIPSADFSLYDRVLDAAFLFGAVPARYRETGLSPLDTYFAMARGFQGSLAGRAVDLHALPMKKWFTTNYHYIAPEIDDGVTVALADRPIASGADGIAASFDPVEAYLEAARNGIETRPSLVGPFTLLKLTAFTGSRGPDDLSDGIADAYAALFGRLARAGARAALLDESALALDLDGADIARFERVSRRLLASKPAGFEVHVNVSFGDPRDAYDTLVALPFDAVGLDFVEGKKNAELVVTRGFPADKTLIAGVVNGKNVWRADADRVRETLDSLAGKVANLAVGPSCSLQHVPVSLEGERSLDPALRARLSFATEKLGELRDMADRVSTDALRPAGAKADPVTAGPGTTCREAADATGNGDLEGWWPAPGETERAPSRAERREIQRAALPLPPLPSTTIGSFPQTSEIRGLRARLRKGEIDEATYDAAVRGKIAECVAYQDGIGLDVLVHGEFERNDMVEFFGSLLEGFVFTSLGWVQSYGTRCVKPPIVAGDVSRRKPMTVELSRWAQTLASKPVKGMLTGPVTILNWSFPREDIPPARVAFQIARAIREEVLDLERAGVRVIQIDEAALRERLPLRREDWKRDYLDWAIPAFRLTHSGVAPETQIHTHMCYSEFRDIMEDIDAMDADVISFEASRSNLSILSELSRVSFGSAVGPGVYDIHSPRVPAVAEIGEAIGKMTDSGLEIWINPDCGLKTRGEAETRESLENMMKAVKNARQTIYRG